MSKSKEEEKKPAEAEKKKEVCPGCGKEVGADSRTFQEKKWHPDCFKCTVCGKPIKEGKPAVDKGKPCHEDCKPGEKPAAKEKEKEKSSGQKPEKEKETCGGSSCQPAPKEKSSCAWKPGRRGGG
eukprot:RCo036436